MCLVFLYISKCLVRSEKARCSQERSGFSFVQKSNNTKTSTYLQIFSYVGLGLINSGVPRGVAARILGITGLAAIGCLYMLTANEEKVGCSSVPISHKEDRCCLIRNENWPRRF